MYPTLLTRMPVDQLSVGDLEHFPVWEFATDEEDVEGMDETWVKPVASLEIPNYGFSIICACVFKLNCGLVYPGSVCCDTYAGFEVTAISLLTVRDRIVFSEGNSPSLHAQALADLGLTHDQVFPVKYSTRVPLQATGQVSQGDFSLEEPSSFHAA